MVLEQFQGDLEVANGLEDLVAIEMVHGGARLPFGLGELQLSHGFTFMGFRLR